MFKRLISIIPVGCCVVVLVGLMIHLVPGDPVDNILGPFASFEDKEALREHLGLNKPVLIQIKNYLFAILQGNLGESIVYHRPVAEMIMERMGATIELACLSLLIALLISLPSGILSAVKANSFIDYLCMGFSLLGIAMPTFWVGPLLIFIFSIKLGYLPVSGKDDWMSYILPALTMGMALAAALSRMTRTSFLEHIKEDYVRTARAKGLREIKIIGKHVFKNAAIPLVTIIGLQFGVLLTGAVITERIFDWPGIGTLMLEGLGSRDYPLVQGCILLFSCSYLLVNLVTDLLYALIDPRIAYK